MSIQDKAKKRITKWKKQLLKSHEIEKMTGVSQTIISRIFTGNGIVSDEKCQKILDAREEK